MANTAAHPIQTTEAIEAKNRGNAALPGKTYRAERLSNKQMMLGWKDLKKYNEVRMNRLSLLACWLMCSVAHVPVLAEDASDPAATMPVTIVVEISITDSAKRAEASSVVHKLRELFKQNSALLEDTMLENINPDNSPAFAHVTRWASFKDWERVYLSPKFLELTATGRNIYTIRAVAFKKIE